MNSENSPPGFCGIQGLPVSLFPKALAAQPGPGGLTSTWLLLLRMHQAVLCPYGVQYNQDLPKCSPLLRRQAAFTQTLPGSILPAGKCK